MGKSEMYAFDVLLAKLLKTIDPKHHERVTLAVREAYGLGYAVGVQESEVRLHILAETIEHLQEHLQEQLLSE